MMRLPRFLRRLSAPHDGPIAPPLPPDVSAVPVLAPKPRVRLRADGWVRHCPGPFPFAPKAVVETIHAGGLVQTGKFAEYASYWPESWWSGEAISWRHNILFYRIVREPRHADPARLALAPHR